MSRLEEKIVNRPAAMLLSQENYNYFIRTNMEHGITRTIFFLFLLLLAGCAGQRPPEGGPIDSIPPEIISVYPAPNTINYADNRIVLEFSEYVDRRSVEESIFFSPAIQDVEFDWSGTEVSIIFNETLRKNTTYVATIGTDVKDVRNGNRMAGSFSLSFSTGEKIDKGMIRGEVFDEHPDGIMIFTYRINDMLPDTLNPAHTRPDYITQTGTNGKFTLTNLADGTYRLFAIRDEYKNLLYDPETDKAGTTEDVSLAFPDTLKTGVKFILAVEDTTPPRIVSVQAPDNRHVLLSLSEAADPKSVTVNSFAITDTLGEHPLAVKTIYPGDDQFSTFTLVTDAQKENEAYLCTVSGVKDRSGFEINPLAKQKLFTGSAAADTIPPAVFFSSVKDSTSKIADDDSIIIRFSDAVSFANIDSSLSVIRKRDSTAVPFFLKRPDSAAVILKPGQPLLVSELYSILFRWGTFRDLQGNRGKDTVTSIAFGVIDPEQFGSIEGTFAGFGSPSPALIEADNIANKNQRPSITDVSQFGKFKFGRLPEGRYVLKAFSDANKNRIHDAGKVFPFTRAEQFINYPDTLRVRPRWPVDGVNIK